MTETRPKPYYKEPSCLDELVQTLTTIFDSERINVDEVRSVMTNYKSNENDWARFSKFDPHRYTRNLVDEGNGKFNLIVLCWGEGQGSGIHSHSDAHCFMKVLEGELQETMYAWPSESEPDKEMQESQKNMYNRDEVAYICDADGLHRVENISHVNQAVSLHLYSPPFDMCECFDQRTGKKQKVKVTFWSKYGQRTHGQGACRTPSEQAENN
ncbi:cysteine dioxygenase type 1-like [Ptychodera flava]|uniref:cysteine dioxygenase type 1-like n=1 Tax=Ptychodera flava TaxID=63121 RepID=UPI003969E564